MATSSNAISKLERAMDVLLMYIQYLVRTSHLCASEPTKTCKRETKNSQLFKLKANLALTKLSNDDLLVW
jgi:hypothetical protein